MEFKVRAAAFAAMLAGVLGVLDDWAAILPPWLNRVVAILLPALAALGGGYMTNTRAAALSQSTIQAAKARFGLAAVPAQRPAE